jgi:hypothetical protein
MEARFFLPIAPLACYYIWRGIRTLLSAVQSKSRLIGGLWLPLAVLMAMSGAFWIYDHRVIGYGDVPDELLVPAWFVSALVALWMVFTGQWIFSSESLSRQTWIKQMVDSWEAHTQALARYAIRGLVGALFFTGVLIEAKIARENLNITDPADAEKTSISEIMATEVEAGRWLRSNSPAGSVAMARHWPTVYHYADRKMIWFAPISDPDILFQGILKHKVDYLVVVNHYSPYYLPGDDYCFSRLYRAHAANFHLVLQKSDLRIFQVDRQQ